MPDTHQLLELLQADVLAVLQATPALVNANVIADNEGDIEAKVAKALGTLTPVNGKNGLAVVVLLPEVSEGEAGLPGPPLTVKLEVRVLENVLLNRAAATGSLLRSSQAALDVLSALQLRHLGHGLLYAAKDPVAPVEVKKGHVSHAVTLFARFAGFVTPKPAGVAAAMVSGANYLETAFAGNGNDLRFEQVGVGTAPTIEFTMDNSGADSVAVTGTAILVHLRQNFGAYYLTAAHIATLVNASAPALALVTVGYPAGNDGTGQICQPATANIGFGPAALAGGASALQLTCETPDSSIYYTTDGSYPSPDATLYTAPVGGLATGTVVRAAAYVTGMAPGDVLELTVTE